MVSYTSFSKHLIDLELAILGFKTKTKQALSFQALGTILRHCRFRPSLRGDHARGALVAQAALGLVGAPLSYRSAEKLKPSWQGTSLVTRWLRILLPTQRMQIQSLVGELRPHMLQCYEVLALQLLSTHTSDHTHK